MNTHEENLSKTRTILPERLSSVGVEKVADTIWLADNLLSKEECQEIIRASKDNLHRSTVLKAESEDDSRINEGRTSSNAWLLAKDLDPDSYAFEVLHKIETITKSFTDQPIINQEGLQVLKYNEGEEYTSHHDFFHENHKEYDFCMAEGGQRLWTVYFYLNDVEGGDTFFPRLDVKVSPKIGRVAIWQNVVNNEVYHPSLHWGMPPTKGQKWGCTKWIREREFTGDMKADSIIRNINGEAQCEAASKLPEPRPTIKKKEKPFSIKINKPMDTSNAEVIIV